MSQSARALLLIVISGLIIRLALLFTQTPIFWPDSPAYFNWAKDLAAGESFINHAIYRTPGFPYLLALIIKFAPNPALCFLLVQQALGLIGSVILFHLAAEKTTTKIAMATALLFSLNPLQLYYELVVQTECLFTFFLICWLWAATRFVKDQRVATGLALGGTTAALALTRPLGQLLVTIPIFLALIYRQNLKGWVINTAVVTLTYIALVTPWILHNREVYGYTGLSIDLGLNAFHRTIDQNQLPIPMDRNLRSIARPALRERLQGQDSYITIMHMLHRNDLTWKEGDRQMLRFALKSIQLAPLDYLISIPRIFFLSLFYPDPSTQLCESSRGSFLCSHAENIRHAYSFPDTPTNFVEWLRPIVAFTFQLFSLLYLLLVPLFIFGILFRARRLGWTTLMRSDGLFLLIILYFTAITALLNSPEDRFRLPFEGILFFYLASVFELFKRRDERGTARTGRID